MNNVEYTRLNVQSYLIYSIVRTAYDMIYREEKPSQVDFKVDKHIDAKDITKTWLFSGMDPVVIHDGNPYFDTTIMLKEDTVNEIIDKLEVYGNNKNKLLKGSVKEDAKFKYQLFLEADQVTEDYINNILTNQGLRIIDKYINDGVTEKDNEVAINFSNATYLLRLKK